MDGLLDATKLQLFFVFAVPGIVALYVRSQFLAGRLPPVAEGAIAYVVLSLVYHAITYPLATALYAQPIGQSRALAWLALILLGPAIFGLLLGLNVRKGWTKKLLEKIGINIIHPVDSAWDWKFAQCEECWVMAVLKNGTTWLGHLGPQSFMSSDRAERDIFIQQVYTLEADNTWTARTSSVWIAHGEIQSLEFWPRT